MCENKGVYSKYLVCHADGTGVSGRYFVLKPEKDLAARKALRVYAEEVDDAILARDLFSWLDNLAEGKGD